MNLKCRINEKEYDVVVQGTTFSDEYNETLDSGSIILDHIEEIKDLKPYDDVYIYENYEGEFPRSDTERRYYAKLNIDRNNTAKKINVFSNIFYVSENGDNDALSSIDSIISLGGSQNLSFYTKINFYKNNLKIGELYITFPNCLFNIKNNIWNLKNTTSPIFTINQELFSID